MPLFTRTFQIVAGILSVPVIGASIIRTAYTSPFLDHLADIVNGSQTSVVDSTNAPNWSFGLPLAQAVGVAAATSTGGTVASSTAFTFAIAATGGVGTTTLSSSATITTDASTSPNEQIQVTWSAVPGATGYAIFFATSSNATSFSQYFYATSTSGSPNASYTFSTSTGSLAGSYAKADTTAFSALINPNGTSYLNGGPLQVTGGANQTSAYFMGGTNNTSAGNNASADFVACNNLSKVLWPLGANCPS